MQDHDERKYMNCPYNGKECIDGLRSDFKKSRVDGLIHKCRLWVGVAGKLPDSDKVVLHYDCADAWKVTTMIEGAQTNRFAAASSDKVANGMHKAQRNIGRMVKVIIGMARSAKKISERQQLNRPPPGDRID